MGDPTVVATSYFRFGPWKYRFDIRQTDDGWNVLFEGSTGISCDVKNIEDVEREAKRAYLDSFAAWKNRERVPIDDPSRKKTSVKLSDDLRQRKQERRQNEKVHN